MLKIILLLILSPLAILCGIISVTIIYVILKKSVEIVIECVKVIIDSINNRDDNQC